MCLDLHIFCFPQRACLCYNRARTNKGDTQMVIIGLSTNRDFKNGSDCMPKDYVLSVLRAGALPLILPMIPEDNPHYDELMDKTINSVDGIVFTGGPDVDPIYYKEKKLPECKEVVSERDKADFALFSRTMAIKKPFLGICRGLQVCNVALGGSLYQDLGSQFKGANQHEVPDNLRAHTVEVVDKTLLSRLVDTVTLPVTSRHHQAIKQLAPGLKVAARSADGVIEAVEFEDGRPGLCVQWHPENLAGQDKRHQALFDWLVEKAKERQ